MNLRKLPTLAYETDDGQRVVVEADFIVVRGGSHVEQDHIVITNAQAVMTDCNLEAHRCKIDGSGCYFRSLGA